MLNRFILLLALGGYYACAHATVLPAEKLLPRDTALVVTVADAAKAFDLGAHTPFGLLWHDPSIKPFQSKFLDKFSEDVLTPLEHNFGIQFSDYKGLAQGQVTFALVPVNQADEPDRHFAQIFLVDVKDHATQLRTNLAGLRKKWADAGKPMRTEKIRDVEFTTFISTSDELSWSKIFPKAKSPDAADEPEKTKKVELTFGQSESLLLVSDSRDVIEKVLSRQSGGLIPALAEEPSFESDFAARLHGAPVYGWVHARTFIDLVTSAQPKEDDGDAAAIKPNALISATGLSGVTSLCLAYRVLPEGLSGQVFIGAPEAKRRGLLKALTNEPKDSNPPTFVPGDVVKFWRWRINLPHAWTQIESMLNEVNPQASGLLNFILQSAGKDKDEHYNLKSQLLENLGDDVIHYEKAPRGATLADLKAAPAIYLIGSPNPEKLAAALKVGLGFLAQGSGGIKEREFLGRQIYSMAFPSPGKTPPHPFSFAGSSGYLALSSDSDILEEFLRSGDSKGKMLSDTAGLSDAAQKAGGMGTGLFGFNNQNQNMRAVLESVRQQPVTLTDIFGATSMMANANAEDQVAKLREWADFSLLPPFDTISKYFYFSVYTGGFSDDGFTLSFFAPTPPKLR